MESVILKKRINLLSLEDKYKICRLIIFLGYDLKQSPNGAYIKMNEIKNKQKVSSYMKFYLLKKKFAKQSLISNNKNEKHLTHEEYLL